MAVDFMLPSGLEVRAAVLLAEELVVSGRAGAATEAVATLERDALHSEAEQPVREMLAEHGTEVPHPTNEQDDYRVLLRAFGYWDLPLHIFEGPFYAQIPEWDGQGPLDRALVVMLDRRDHETTTQASSKIEQELRGTVRQHVPPR